MARWYMRRCQSIVDIFLMLKKVTSRTRSASNESVLRASNMSYSLLQMVMIQFYIYNIKSITLINLNKKKTILNILWP